MATMNKALIFPNQNNTLEDNALGVHILDINVIPTSKVTQSPAIDGLDLNDNKVRNPIKVRVKCALLFDDNKDDVLKNIDEMLSIKMENGKPVFSSILTHLKYYSNLTLVEGPHRETVDSIDVYEFDLVFQEIILMKKDGGIQAAPEFSGFIDCGLCGASSYNLNAMSDFTGKGLVGYA